MSVGELLRSRRQQQGLTLADVESATKIRAHYIASLESEEFAELPGEVYLVGFLKIYARLLGLDPDVVVAEYRSQHETPEHGHRADSRRAQDADQDAAIPPQHPAGSNGHFHRIWQGIARATDNNRKLVLGTLTVIICLLVVASLVFSVFRFSRSWRPRTGQPSVPQSTYEAPAPPPQQYALEITVHAKEMCWTQVEVDGVTSYTGNMQPGDTKVFQGNESVWMHLGNAGGVVLYYNGTELPSLGAEWAPVTKEFTKAGAPPASTAPGGQPGAGEPTTGESTQGSGQSAQEPGG